MFGYHYIKKNLRKLPTFVIFIIYLITKKVKDKNKHKKDLTTRFQDILSRVDHKELGIVLSYYFRNSSTDPKTSTITYGSKNENKLYITYKKDAIEKIEVDSNFSESSAQKIEALIKKQLIGHESQELIISDVLFARYPFKSPFRYKDTFIIEPCSNYCPEDMARPHPVILHYKYIQRSNELGFLEANSRGNILEEIINLICVFTKGNVYRVELGNRVWIIDDESKSSKLKQTGYLYNNQDNNSKYKFNTDTENPSVQYPNLDTNLIDMYFALKQDLQEKFIRGCQWYHMAKMSLRPEHKHLFYITMIENFFSSNRDSQNKHQNLLKKYQDINNQKFQDRAPQELLKKLLEEYENIIKNQEGVSKQFKSILKKYCGIDDDKLCNSLYALRSRISHQGKLAGGDKIHVINLMQTPENVLEKHLIMMLSIICDCLLINWLKFESTNEPVPSTSIEKLFENHLTEVCKLDMLSFFHKL